MKRKPKKRSAAEKAAREHFRHEVLNAGYCVEHGAACEREIQDPHHIVKVQLIRSHLLPLHLPDAELWPIVFDPRIGVRLCRPWHEAVDGHRFPNGERVYLRPEQLPWQAVTYCQDHDFMALLERAVPLFAGSDR